MSVTKFGLVLPTHDLKRCMEFYVEGLLFKKVYELPEYCLVSLDSFELTFCPAKKEHVQARRTDFSFSLRVDDIQGYFDRVKRAGRVKFVQELEFMQPGVWQFVLLDCNGYRVGFAMS